MPTHSLRQRGLALAGISELEPPYEQARKAQHFHLILYTFAGSAKAELNGQSLRFEPGVCWLVPEHTAVHYELDQPYWEIIWWHFWPSAHWQSFAGRPRQLALANPGRIRELMAGLIDEGERETADSAVAGRGYAETLCVLLDRLRGEGESPRVARQRAELSALWEHVDANLNRDWTTQALAASLHVSVGHLHRLCREISECAPMEMVGQLRMRRAEELLRSTDAPFYCVASAIGYDSPNAFSRAFKRHAGISPREFRKAFAAEP